MFFNENDTQFQEVSVVMDLCLCGKNQQSDISNLTNTPRERNNRKHFVILFPTTLFKTLSVYYLSLSQSLFFSLTRYLIISPSLCISLSLYYLSLSRSVSLSPSLHILLSLCLTTSPYLSLTRYLIISPSLSLHSNTFDTLQFPPKTSRISSPG